MKPARCRHRVSASRLWAISAVVSSLLAVVPPVAAGTCEAQSGPQRAALIELYTSEGCSSCPPADRWLSRLPLAGAAPQVVPLAFHVDYWDYIGWKDRFADPAWSERQRKSVIRGGGRIVYTPQVIRNGRDFPRWAAAGAFEKASAAQATVPVRIGLNLASAPGGLKVAATLTPAGITNGTPQIYLALTESGLTSTVKAGENRGATLAHDHVVRSLVSPGPSRPGSRDITHVFMIGDGWKRANLAVVAFVQDEKSGEILQALRLPNCAAGPSSS